MFLSRTTARAALLLLLSWGLAVTAYAHRGEQQGAPPERIVFPIVGSARYTNDFGDPRPGGVHQAVDILAARRAPVVASEGGKVTFWSRSARAGCMLYLYGKSGTTYLYIHLNNDLTKGNDNRGRCVPGVAFAPGLRTGARVEAGDLIGYAGDSGDANGANPHLHFELHPRGGAAVSPYPWLRRARHILFTTPTRAAESVRASASVVLALAGTVVSVDVSRERPRLTLRVKSVRLPDRSKLTLSRAVTLTVADDALVEELVKGRKRAGALEGTVRGSALLVRTAPVAPTLKAKLAPAGFLEASAVLVLRRP